METMIQREDSPMAIKSPGSFKVRMSFSRRDLGLAPLYQQMVPMTSEAERRAFLRHVLYQALSQRTADQPRVASPAIQAPVLPATLVVPAAPQLKEITAGVVPIKGGATPRGGKAEIFKKLGMLD